MRDDTINIRLAGDGTEIGDNITVLNMSFGFLDPVKLNTNPNAVTGNFFLGVFNLKSECYNELKTALKEFRSFSVSNGKNNDLWKRIQD